jgi:hypothetical protein
MNQSLFNRPFPVILLCLTLGLAPFVPEPHIVGKVRWLLGGAEGMQPLDYFDLLLHGFPWVLLIRLGVLRGEKLLKG